MGNASRELTVMDRRLRTLDNGFGTEHFSPNIRHEAHDNGVLVIVRLGLS